MDGRERLDHGIKSDNAKTHRRFGGLFRIV